MAPTPLGFARVAVNAPAAPITVGETDVSGAFHYAIPPSLQGSLRTGHLVWVPFGRRRLAGIVIELCADPGRPVREIEGLAADEPVVIATQIALGLWMAREYLVPAGRALWAMLPPGVGRRSETWLEPAIKELPGDAALTPNQRAIWNVLQTRSSVPLAQLGRLARVAGWREAAAALESKGLVRRWEGDVPPPARPARARFLRPVPGGDATTLTRAPRQRALYEHLVAHGGDWLPQHRLLQATGATRQAVDALIARGLVEATERDIWRDPLAGRAFVLEEPPRLTSDQQQALDLLTPAIAAGTHRTFLLHGVTGSGKTEIYLQAVAQTLAQGRRAVVLVPEIALTPQTIRRFAARFPGRVAVCHSQLGAGERYDLWRRAMANQIDIVVGPRSALFLPLRRLGLIVVDEEHEPSYKQDTTPRYHAREAAVALGKIAEACVILGSATPDLVTAYRTQQKRYTLISLPQRVISHRQAVEEQCARLEPGRPWPARPLAAEGDALYGKLPAVEVVDLRRELREGNRSIFSRSLAHALDETLAAHAQAILFLNRRGSATFVMCRDCGHTLTCGHCQVALTYHGIGRELVCHHCNWRQPAPSICPRCRSHRIKYFGLGTQRVVEEVRALFPQARVVRWDRDAVSQRGKHEEILRQFVEHEADVLVGTQMVAKGLDLPLVTLVGVISADTALHLPDYRAAERTFQLLTQVAGRAGRSPLGGKVIIQTYTPEHYAIQAASRHDYRTFYRRELAFRREQNYPPFTRLVRLLYSHEDPGRARQEATTLAATLEERRQALGLTDLDLLGPAPCPLERLRGQYRWHLFVRGPDPYPLLRGFDLPRGWRLDVDPGNVL